MEKVSVKDISKEVNSMECVATMNIYQKMSAVTNELKRVAKKADVGVGKSAYKAVSEADILEAVKPLEEKYHIYSFPFLRNIEESGLMENEKIDYYTQNPIKTKQLYMRIQTVYRFINTDCPDEYIDVNTFGDGVDSQDKAPGKAMTYADKYALMKAYKIITGDDPDLEASAPLNGVKNKKTSTNDKTKNTKEDDASNHLMIDWQQCRTKLTSLGVDLRSEEFMQYIADKTGFPNQDADIKDIAKMKKLVSVYKDIIINKETKKNA